MCLSENSQTNRCIRGSLCQPRGGQESNRHESPENLAVENLFHDLLFWVTIRRSNQRTTPLHILLRFCRTVPFRSLRFPGVSETARKCRDSEAFARNY